MNRLNHFHTILKFFEHSRLKFGSFPEFSTQQLGSSDKNFKISNLFRAKFNKPFFLRET